MMTAISLPFTTTSEKAKYEFKIILLGDSGVGKTSLMWRYAKDIFNQDIMSTLGVDYEGLFLRIGDTLVKMTIWDTAGQERFRSISKMYTKGSHGVIFMYDICNRHSFNHVIDWIGEFNANNPDSTGTVMMLVGTKSDMHEVRDVSTDEGTRLAADYAMLFLEVSSLTGHNISDTFHALAKQCVRVHPETKNLINSIVKIDQTPYLPQHTPQSSYCC